MLVVNSICYTLIIDDLLYAAAIIKFMYNFYHIKKLKKEHKYKIAVYHHCLMVVVLGLLILNPYF